MRYFNALILVFVNTLLLSQNIIDNGCFEKGKCPDMRGDGSYVCEDWFTVGSADYFSSCSNGEVRPINNFIGSQIPHSGNSYVGIFTGRDIDVSNTEIIYTRLNKSLIKGEEYIISFHYSLADKCGQVSNAIGLSLSKELAFEKKESGLGEICIEKFPLKYNVLVTEEKSLSDDKNWSFFSDTILAEGGEAYLYISGVNKIGSPLKGKKASNGFAFKDWSYYYVDDVLLFGLDRTNTIEELSCDINIRNYFFSNIYFVTNSHVLNGTSISSLNTLAEVLQENPAWGVTIQGHADAVGNEKENLALSETRANAVKEFLLSQGIKIERIKIEAMGSSTPLSSNTSEEERAKNRRVEIFLVKN